MLSWLKSADHTTLPFGSQADPVVCCKLFDGIVAPVINYGCEVWGVSPGIAGKQAESVQLDFIRSILKVSKTTSHAVLPAEFGRLPLNRTWWKQVLRYHDW